MDALNSKSPCLRFPSTRVTYRHHHGGLYCIYSSHVCGHILGRWQALMSHINISRTKLFYFIYFFFSLHIAVCLPYTSPRPSPHLPFSPRSTLPPFPFTHKKAALPGISTEHGLTTYKTRCKLLMLNQCRKKFLPMTFLYRSGVTSTSTF